MTTLEILLEMKKLLRYRKNWIKNALYEQRVDGTNCYCLVGALCQAATGDYAGYNNEAVLRVGKAMRFTPDSPQAWPDAYWIPMVQFNNADSTDHKKLMARIDKAISRVRARYGHTPAA